MKIVLVTTMTPTRDNINGASAHPYHILKGRDKNIDVEVYSFNGNKLSQEGIKQVEQELNVTIKTFRSPKWILWMIKLHLTFLKVFLKYPLWYYNLAPDWVINEIKAKNPDGIWVYGHEMARTIKALRPIKTVNMMPDCQSLYHYRMMGQRFVFSNALMFLGQNLMYRKYLAMERDYSTDNVRYSLVGREDAKMLENVHPGIDANFVHHPHYDVYEPNKVIKFSSPRIKVVLAGQYNLYMKQSADDFTAALCEVNDISGKFDFTFLGKGWENTVDVLGKHGYHVSHIRFAEDYKKELCNHDVQFTPICIGTGTKGKVLDALANGLLVLGTEYAMENIEVVYGESCVMYRTVEGAIDILRDIAANPQKYEKMAENGRQSILRYHSRQQAAKEFFSLFN